MHSFDNDTGSSWRYLPITGSTAVARTRQNKTSNGEKNASGRHYLSRSCTCRGYLQLLPGDKRWTCPCFYSKRIYEGGLMNWGQVKVSASATRQLQIHQRIWPVLPMWISLEWTLIFLWILILVNRDTRTLKHLSKKANMCKAWGHDGRELQTLG
jgi:hypothetical protein